MDVPTQVGQPRDGIGAKPGGASRLLEVCAPQKAAIDLDQPPCPSGRCTDHVALPIERPLPAARRVARTRNVQRPPMDRARLTHAQLRTPRAAGVAGILFSLLLFATFGLLRLSVPGDPFEPGAWLGGSLRYVTLAMNLVPFAGVAFLWFVGVLRDRLGEREDQFFATVFLGSGFLLLAMLFAAAAVFSAIIVAFHAAPEALMHSAT